MRIRHRRRRRARRPRGRRAAGQPGARRRRGRPGRPESWPGSVDLHRRTDVTDADAARVRAGRGRRGGALRAGRDAAPRCWSRPRSRRASTRVVVRAGRRRGSPGRFARQWCWAATSTTPALRSFVGASGVDVDGSADGRCRWCTPRTSSASFVRALLEPDVARAPSTSPRRATRRCAPSPRPSGVRCCGCRGRRAARALHHAAARHRRGTAGVDRSGLRRRTSRSRPAAGSTLGGKVLRPAMAATAGPARSPRSTRPHPTGSLPCPPDVDRRQRRIRHPDRPALPRVRRDQPVRGAARPVLTVLGLGVGAAARGRPAMVISARLRPGGVVQREMSVRTTGVFGHRLYAGITSGHFMAQTVPLVDPDIDPLRLLRTHRRGTRALRRRPAAGRAARRAPSSCGRSRRSPTTCWCSRRARAATRATSSRDVAKLEAAGG